MDNSHLFGQAVQSAWGCRLHPWHEHCPVSEHIKALPGKILFEIWIKELKFLSFYPHLLKLSISGLTCCFIYFWCYGSHLLPTRRWLWVGLRKLLSLDQVEPFFRELVAKVTSHHLHLWRPNTWKLSCHVLRSQGRSLSNWHLVCRLQHHFSTLVCPPIRTACLVVSWLGIYQTFNIVTCAISLKIPDTERARGEMLFQECIVLEKVRPVHLLMKKLHLKWM